jgi:nucleotidyltransferase/DNA polymerase involved in DNA repair
LDNLIPFKSCQGKLLDVRDEIMQALKAIGYKSLTLKMKFADYQQITRSRTLLEWIEGETQILNLALDLLDRVHGSDQKIRLLGIAISNLDQGDLPLHYEQLVLELGAFQGSTHG